MTHDNFIGVFCLFGFFLFFGWFLLMGIASIFYSIQTAFIYFQINLAEYKSINRFPMICGVMSL